MCSLMYLSVLNRCPSTFREILLTYMSRKTLPPPTFSVQAFLRHSDLIPRRHMPGQWRSIWQHLHVPVQLWLYRHTLWKPSGSQSCRSPLNLPIALTYNSATVISAIFLSHFGTLTPHRGALTSILWYILCARCSNSPLRFSTSSTSWCQSF